MPCIFLSYRREDSAGHAGRIYDRLVAHIGEGAVFRDIDGIAPGQDFVRVIEDRLRGAAAAVVVIGPKWLSCVGADGRRRLDDAGDFVRLEVATSLRTGACVIPVLVAGARMPREEDLPADLQALARANAITISEELFEESAGRLIRALEAAIRTSHKLSLWERMQVRLEDPDSGLRHQVRSRIAIAVFVLMATLLTRMLFDASPVTTGAEIGAGATLFIALCWLAASLAAGWMWRRLIRRRRAV